MKREPAILVGIGVALLAALVRWLDLPALDTDTAEAVVNTVLTLAGALLVRAKVMPTATIKDAGMDPALVKERAENPAVPPFREAGWSTLVVSYRNDGEAPRSPDGRYALGDEEWEDVEAALRWVAERGATSVVLVGWSMGGATVLQAATRASGRELVVGLVLDPGITGLVIAYGYILQAPLGVLTAPVRERLLGSDSVAPRRQRMPSVFLPDADPDTDDDEAADVAH